MEVGSDFGPSDALSGKPNSAKVLWEFRSRGKLRAVRYKVWIGKVGKGPVIPKNASEWATRQRFFYALGEPGPVRINEGWTEISFREGQSTRSTTVQASEHEVSLEIFANCIQFFDSADLSV
jgi:hypothetical protein